MLKERRIVKKLIAMLLIMAIILPYTSEALAVALKHTDSTVKLETSIEHEGGDESSGLLPEEYWEDYDHHQYSYQIANSSASSDTHGRTTVFKIRKEGDNDFEDALYCVNAQKSFPSDGAQEYKNIGDLKEETEQAATMIKQSIGEKNYQSLIWLIDNIYLRKQQPGDKMEFIKKAFADKIAESQIPPLTAELIASIITDDDIEVVQQWAIWYFTNGNPDGYSEEYKSSYYDAKYSKFGTVYVRGMSTGSEYKTFQDIDPENGARRQELLQALYTYLVNSAKNASKASEYTYPTFAMQNTSLTCTVDDEYYKVGPFKVNEPTAPASSYSIQLVDKDGREISREDYEILIDGDSHFTEFNVNQIFDQNYYIYVPMDSDITNVKITIHYSKYETQATLWKVQSDDTYQPVVLITRGEVPYEDSREKEIEKKIFDLALRKYIIKVGNTEITNRVPSVNVDTIEEKGTAEYKHRKDPITVEAGTNVVYEIRVYNEGEIDGTAKQITDFLPEGMTLAQGSTINETYRWQETSNPRIVTTDYLSEETIEAYDGVSDELDSRYVQIECTVNADLAETISNTRTLTNVAEITVYSREDKDSWKSIDPTTISDDFSGKRRDDKPELNDPNYYYEGLQDDDDFEKLQVEPLVKPKVFDLNLKKFITSINGQKPTVDRTPKVDVTNLKNGSSTDATYTQTKTRLEVKKGDIITYTLRVYNEGEVAGYAEKISDFLPEGLGYLMNYSSNVTNKWTIPTNAKTMKLSEIENGTANVKESDFTGGTSLEDQIVVVGGGKFTSIKLNSESTDNLIQAFDKETGTKLDYKDIQITCIVLTDTAENNNLKNIAEIAEDSDENKEPIDDVDSIPDTVDPNNYPDGEKEKNNGKPQDDHDYEDLKTPTTEEKFFDLALQKFITKVNNDAVTNREPVVTKNDDGSFRYSHTSEPLAVANTDLVTYTIRVYNEGDLNGYAKEVMDDIPIGLQYLPDNEVNKQYGWKMYDKNGKETTDVNQAVSVKTTYLSKENEKIDESTRPADYTPEKYPYYTPSSNLLLAYDSEIMKTPHYRDVQLVFQVVESALPNKNERAIKNTAEITDDQDENGKDVDDRDSTPGNNKTGEDDIDNENVVLKYFDLALKKNLVKIVITENGKTREITPRSPEDLLKVEINRKYLSSTTVKFVYDIIVTNEGQIEGYAKEIKDYIPEGLVFVQADNPNWTAISADTIKTEALANTLIQPGQSATVQVTLQWNNSENNLGEKINVAEISKDENPKGSPDIDSTPDNKKDGEDDIDDAPVILSISTGEEPVYVVLSTTVLTILATGIFLIKKYVLI